MLLGLMHGAYGTWVRTTKPRMPVRSTMVESSRNGREKFYLRPPWISAQIRCVLDCCTVRLQAVLVDMALTIPSFILSTMQLSGAGEASVEIHSCG